MPFLVCVHNHANPAGQVPGSTHLHRAVFLVARITSVEPAYGDNRPNRWKICIGEFFRHSVPDAWGRWPNPVRYTTLGAIGVRLADLEFHPVEEAQRHIARLTERRLQRERA